MSSPPVQQDQRVVGAEAAQSEGPHDVIGIRDALAREVDRGRERLQDLAGLAGTLLCEGLGGVDVHGNGELLGARVPSPGPDDQVDGREPNGLPP